MPADESDPHLRIGAALREERERQGLELDALEERTKIRTRYLRALENEDWDIIPGPTYVRGFLRTYAESLGLDAEALVDDYREEFEAPFAPQRGLPETVLTEHREARGAPGSRRGWLIAALVLGLVALLLVLGLSSGSDDDEGRDGKGNAERQKQASKGGTGGEGEDDSSAEEGEEVPETVELELAPRTDSEVCLVNKGGAVLIDNQVLNPEDDEKFEADAFDLSLGFGEVEITVNGEKQRIEASSDAPVTYRVMPGGVRQPIPDTDPDCP
jgi:cytoskeleton protein RodZ